MNHHPAMTTLDSIKKNLVALRMPRALEVLDATFRRIEQGEIDGIEALDTLLVEELTVRENRRVKTALMMARLTEATETDIDPAAGMAVVDRLKKDGTS